MFKIIQFHKWECWLVMGNNVSGKLGPVVYIESMGWCFEIQVKVILVGSVFPSWFWFFSIGRFFSIICKVVLTSEFICRNKIFLKNQLENQKKTLLVLSFCLDWPNSQQFQLIHCRRIVLTKCNTKMNKFH